VPKIGKTLIVCNDEEERRKEYLRMEAYRVRLGKIGGFALEANIKLAHEYLDSLGWSFDNLKPVTMVNALLDRCLDLEKCWLGQDGNKEFLAREVEELRDLVVYLFRLADTDGGMHYALMAGESKLMAAADLVREVTDD